MLYGPLLTKIILHPSNVLSDHLLDLRLFLSWNWGLFQLGVLYQIFLGDFSNVGFKLWASKKSSFYLPGSCIFGSGVLCLSSGFAGQILGRFWLEITIFGMLLRFSRSAFLLKVRTTSGHYEVTILVLRTPVLESDPWFDEVGMSPPLNPSKDFCLFRSWLGTTMFPLLDFTSRKLLL